MGLLIGMRIGAILTPIVPTPLAYWICRAIGFVLFCAKFRTRRAVLDNLRHVAPERSWFWREYQAARVFISATMNYYDLQRLRLLDRTRLPTLIELHGQEHLERARARGKGVIVLSAHIGNFNVVAQYPAMLGYQGAIIAEQVHPPALFRYLTALRSALGITVLPPGAPSVLPILRLLRQNGILLVTGDRDVTGHAKLVPFFDAPAPLPVGPAVLALRTGAALVPAFTVRRGTRKSVVYILPEIILSRTGNPDIDVTNAMHQIARVLESMIRTDPGQWTMLQRVWPHPERAFVSQPESWGAIPAELVNADMHPETTPSIHPPSPATRTGER